MNVKILCDRCKQNEVQIYNDNGNCCLSCWYDMTDPSVSSELGFFSEANDNTVADIVTTDWHLGSIHFILLKNLG
jgi:hypothetical protein